MQTPSFTMICRTFFIKVLLAFIAVGSLSCFHIRDALDEIKIGVLIRHRGLEEPLNRTLEMLNADTSVLLQTRLVAILEVIESDNSYQASAAG